MSEGVRIVCVTGMPGAGKTTATAALVKEGFTSVSMGDVIRKEAARRGMGLDGEGQRRTMLLLREEEGPAAVARLCGDEIRRLRLTKVVIDGARSMDEVEYFKTLGKVWILGIHASPMRRFKLLTARGRKDDPMSYPEFRARDERELDLGLGRVIAMSDRMIENEEISIEDLALRVREVVRGWLAVQ